MKSKRIIGLVGFFLLTISLMSCNIEHTSREQKNNANDAVISNGALPTAIEYPEKRSEEEILKMILDYEGEHTADNTEITSTKPTVSITECIIPDLYEKTGIQAYTAYAKADMVNGTYLIYEDQVYPIVDPLEKTCIADIDQNGTYELLSLWGFGSGIYRIQLNVYQCFNPSYISSTTKLVQLNYSNMFIPKQGYGELEFKKVSDTEVHLVDGDTKTDYGKIIVPECGTRIVLQDMENFPYEEWPYAPSLIVTIGDIELTNHLTLVDWNGTKEEPVSFVELMKEEIPMFTCTGKEETSNEVKLSFAGIDVPTSIIVKDYLINENGSTLYTPKEVIEQEVERREDGSYYFTLEPHMALFLSSRSSSYTEPAYRGFRVSCEFGEGKSCEYVFVLSTAPVWKEIK